MHPYRSFINNYHRITDAEWLAVETLLVRREIRKVLPSVVEKVKEIAEQ